MRLTTIHHLKLMLIVTLLLTMQACGDYSIRLPGNYFLVRVYAGAALITDSQHVVVVNANIDSYKVVDGLVVGHVTREDYFSKEEKEVCRPGHFIMNTKTGDIKQGLDKKTWLDLLRSLGINGEPNLSKPSRFDKNY